MWFFVCFFFLKRNFKLFPRNETKSEERREIIPSTSANEHAWKMKRSRLAPTGDSNLEQLWFWCFPERKGSYLMLPPLSVPVFWNSDPHLHSCHRRCLKLAAGLSCAAQMYFTRRWTQTYSHAIKWGYWHYTPFWFMQRINELLNHYTPILQQVKPNKLQTEVQRCESHQENPSLWG